MLARGREILQSSEQKDDKMSHIFKKFRFLIKKFKKKEFKPSCRKTTSMEVQKKSPLPSC